MRYWVVYVAGAKAQVNYSIGKQKGIWGLKKITSQSQINNMQVGDQIIFVQQLKWQSINGDVPKGFPKFLKDPQQFKGIVSEIVIGEITKGYYQDSSIVWQDNEYRHRFNFKIKEQVTNVLFNMEEFGSELIEATLKSIKSGGDVCFVGNNKIINFTKIDDFGLDIDPNELKDFSVNEGYVKFIENHKYLERNRKIVKLKKQKVLTSQKCLKCEICGFDFADFYGEELGQGFAECHHINPLSESGNVKTKLSDLIIICANCHKMIHRRKPWLSPQELKGIVENQKSVLFKRIY